MSIPTITDIAGIIAAPELKFTNSGKAILNVRLAFNDSKYDEQTQKWINSKTFYVDGQAWEQTAERLANQLAQGDQVYVTGRLETQSWEKDGEKKSKAVLNIQAARKLAKNEAGAQQHRTTQQAAQEPWGGQQQANVPNPQWNQGSAPF
jgi:single-strand DNA-binding protein